MLGPIRSLYALRPGAPLSLLLSAVATALMFVATPFLLPELAASYEVTEGFASMISVAQVGAFSATTLLVPRFLAPSGRLLRVTAAALFIANLVSALQTSFGALVAVRLVAGGAAGVMTWIMWLDAMGSPRSLASISSVGPLVALVGAPMLAVVGEQGDRMIYLTLAVGALPPVLAPLHEPLNKSLGRPGKRVVSRSRSNRVLLGALFLLTMSGASLFIFEAVAAAQVLGVGSVAASWGFSLNAAGGLLGARLASRHKRPGWWLAAAGPAAVLTIAGGRPVFFFVGMAWWGFAFWMGVPGVLQMMAERSLDPGERAGDAQGIMAIGRTVAPTIGAGFADAGAYIPLALVSGIGVTVSGAIVMAVQEGRELLPPTVPPAPRA